MNKMSKNEEGSFYGLHYLPNSKHLKNTLLSMIVNTLKTLIVCFPFIERQFPLKISY